MYHVTPAAGSASPLVAHSPFSFPFPAMRTYLLVVTLFGIAARAMVAQPLLNRGAAAERVPTKAPSPPAGGDTVGYWQQRADYRVVVTLDEDQQPAHAAGHSRYVNASPDTLRALWLHQHLTAFRQGSRWSARDSAQGRAGYQALPEPEFAFERFTAAPRVSGVRVAAEYPLAPDSTVVRVPLLWPLAPRDSVDVQLAWDARASTLPRRQARKGRHYDFAQWFPKVAVYDRVGWQLIAFVRQGELYGEFGTFDVTFPLPREQVIAATGVPMSGDPAWTRVLVPGSAAPRLARQAYGSIAVAPSVTLPAGNRAVRFVAKQVHHFGWSVSPDYRFEGAAWVRPRAKPGGWDTVSLHAVRENWHPGTTRADLLHAMRWLEGYFGQYAWPQLTVAQRLDEAPITYSEYLAAGVARVPLAVELEARGWHGATTIPDSAVRRRARMVNSVTADVERGRRPLDCAPTSLPPRTSTTPSYTTGRPAWTRRCTTSWAIPVFVTCYGATAPDGPCAMPIAGRSSGSPRKLPASHWGGSSTNGSTGPALSMAASTRWRFTRPLWVSTARGW